MIATRDNRVVIGVTRQGGIAGSVKGTFGTSGKWAAGMEVGRPGDPLRIGIAGRITF